jgi:hypothetical protein
VEECDLLQVIQKVVLFCAGAHAPSVQGVQTMFDVDTFAPFTLELLGRVHDELPKSPILAIPSLGTALIQRNDPRQASTVILQRMRPLILVWQEQSDSARKLLNEALALRGLFEISNLTVPLQSPSSWKPGQWSSLVDADVR